MAEGAEEAVKEDLRFAFFVTLELGGEGDEFFEVLRRRVHCLAVGLRPGAGAPRNSPSVLKSSSMPGQWMP